MAVRMMKEFVVRFGDLPTDQAWHIQNIINHLLILSDRRVAVWCRDISICVGGGRT